MAILSTVTAFSAVQIDNGTQGGGDFNRSTGLTPPTVTTAQSNTMVNTNDEANAVQPGTLIFNSDNGVTAIQYSTGGKLGAVNWVTLDGKAGGPVPNLTVTNGNGSTLITTAATVAKTPLVLPANDGNPDDILSTDGAGNTSWTAAGAGTVTGANLTANTIVIGNANSAIKTSTVEAGNGTLANVASISFPGTGGNNANTIILQSGATTISYPLTLPLAQGAANSVLTNDGNGALAWVAPNNLAAAGLYKIAATDANGNAATLALTVAPSGIISALAFEDEQL